MTTSAAEELREEVRRRYAEAARSVSEGSSGCCGSGSCCADGSEADFGEALYSVEQRGELPDAAALASLGCGNPVAVAELREGETVLDLGSGGGIDVILSAKRVGATGIAYGLDMTDEMLALARRNAEEAGVRNAIFLKGVIEDVPLPAESVDVVISNCVVNLSTDKAAVLTEIARVLRPGGRVGISDVVAEDRLGPDGARRARQLRRLHRRGALGLGVRGRARGGGVRRRRASSSRTRSRTGCTARSSRPSSAEAPVPEVLFVCVHNAGRSQMAAGLVTLRSNGRIARPLGRQRSRRRSSTRRWSRRCASSASISARSSRSR